jgi:hypothetical protein
VAWNITSNNNSPEHSEQDALKLRLIPSTERSHVKILKWKALYIDDEEIEEARDGMESMELDNKERGCEVSHKGLVLPFIQQ